MANLIAVQNRSKSNPSAKPYETVVDDTGRFGCQCRGWTVLKTDPDNPGKNKPRFCTHCEDIQRKYNLKVRYEGDYVYATNLGNLRNVANPVPGSVAVPVPTTRKKSAPTKQTAVVDGIKIIDFDDDDEVIPVSNLAQAVADAEANIAANAPVHVYVDPMLAQPMPNVKDHKIETVLAELKNYPAADWALEEKFDGHRVIVSVSKGQVKAWSRPGKDKDGKAKQAIVRTLPKHVEAEFKTFPDCTVDGEDYVPGMMSTDVTESSNTEARRFVVFDITNVAGNDATGQTYDVRRELLEKVFEHVGGNNVTLADSVKPTAAFVRKILARGGEGGILKRRAATYQAGRRSPDVIKIKGLETALMKIDGFEKGKLGPASRIKVRNPKDNSETTVAAMGGGKELVEEMNANGKSHIGRMCYIEYQFRTPDGSYRHPRWDRWENQ